MLFRNSLYCLIFTYNIICPQILAEAKKPRDIAQQTFPSVVMLVMEDSIGRPLSFGSGFFVEDGIVATNRHVVERATGGYARIVGEKQKYDIVGYVGVDNERDLLLLKINKVNAPSITLGDSSKVKVGDEVFVVGNPEGLEGTFSSGMISAIRNFEEENKLFQITAPISPGSSGGPVLDGEGNVIGISVASLVSGQNLNFAIHVSYLSNILADIKPVKVLSAISKPVKRPKLTNPPPVLNPPILDPPKAGTDYLAILLQGQKVGHAVHERRVENNKVVTTDSFSMTLGRGGQAITVTSQETHSETMDGEPLGFEMSMVTSGIEQKTTGTIQNGKAMISRQVMGQAQELTVDWPADALLSEGLRQFQLERGLTPGDAFQVKLFRPDLLMSVQADVRVQDKTEIDLLGRPVELTKVNMTMSIGGQNIEMVSYVDEKTRALKTIVPMMGMTLEMVACDKSFAMRDDDIVDFLEKLSVASPVKLMNLHKIDSASYTLKPTADKKFELPVSPSQTVESTEDGLIVTVTRVRPAENITFPYKGDHPEVLEALKPSDYLQCDDEKVIDLARHAVGTTEDAATAATQIEAFVDGYITQKDLSVGYASAAEVAQSRQGDCSEHAVLTAAMCRAVGIPARVVCGVVYADSFLSKQSIFGGHMWTEVYLGDVWVGLDATRSERRGFGPGHIAFAHGNGDPTDFFSLINTLGCFEIEKITLEKKKKEPEAAIAQ